MREAAGLGESQTWGCGWRLTGAVPEGCGAAGSDRAAQQGMREAAQEELDTVGKGKENRKMI
jgi:hypothetical protein